MYCRAHSLFVAVVVALGILSMIDACGYKGPLYLPPPKGETAPAPDAKPAAAASQPAVTGPGSADTGLLAWPTGRPGGCTVGCTGAAGASQ